MNEVEKLLSEWNKLNTDEEKSAFDVKMKSLIDSKSKEEMDAFAEDFFRGAEKACKEAEELIEFVTIRLQLEPIIPYISLSTIAKEYFGKSRNWLYQRINGNLVNGKPAKFSDEEKKTLKMALEDITHKLQGVSIALN
ncbi:MAG: hypothetical protein BGN96_16775 [Bacteroidales bacterium 45-6]|nr:MAG: hypothetical protein BGN96_16775 [Bacteroidales bacterium 45-6]